MVIIDEVTRRLVVGLPPAYIIERLESLRSVEELQAMAILATLEPADSSAESEEEPA